MRGFVQTAVGRFEERDLPRPIMAYTGTIGLGALSVLTGFAIWKPVSLPWVATALGGYELSRFWHFLTVWGFVGFLLVHLFMTLVVDREATRAMILGPYRESADA